MTLRPVHAELRPNLRGGPLRRKILRKKKQKRTEIFLSRSEKQDPWDRQEPHRRPDQLGHLRSPTHLRRTDCLETSLKKEIRFQGPVGGLHLFPGPYFLKTHPRMKTVKELGFRDRQSQRLQEMMKALPIKSEKKQPVEFRELKLRKNS